MRFFSLKPMTMFLINDKCIQQELVLALSQAPLSDMTNCFIRKVGCHAPNRNHSSSITSAMVYPIKEPYIFKTSSRFHFVLDEVLALEQVQTK